SGAAPGEDGGDPALALHAGPDIGPAEVVAAPGDGVLVTAPAPELPRGPVVGDHQGFVVEPVETLRIADAGEEDRGAGDGVVCGDGAVELQAQKLSREGDRKSTRLNSSHVKISYAVFCLKKKNEK